MQFGRLIIGLLMFMAGSWAAEPPQVTARAAVVLDQATGRILFSKMPMNSAMASTTKIMTAVLAIESGRLSETVTVMSRQLCGSSSVELEAGEENIRRAALRLILRSGINAAMAIFLAGSVEKVLTDDGKGPSVGCGTY